jgi:hypothetical protein
MNDRIRLLAWTYIIACAASLVIGAFICIGLLLSADNESRISFFWVTPFFLGLSTFFFLPGLIGGLGLLRGKTWGRKTLIVVSFLLLPLFPVGTALGALSLWVLLNRNPTPIAKTERGRVQGILVAMAGVAAAFIVTIGAGFRLTRTTAPPIIDSLYWGSIAVLVAVIVLPVRSPTFRTWRATSRAGREWVAAQRRELEEQRRAQEEEHRQRLARLSADPVRRKYVERIERGEAWSDEQIDYAEDPTRLATCPHLQPIERTMRDSAIEVRLEWGTRVIAHCVVDREAFAATFSPPPFVNYLEPRQEGRAHEDPPAALIACDRCVSRIVVVHPDAATPTTPKFPTPETVPSMPDAGSVPNEPEDPHVREHVYALARKIGASDYMLPTFGYSEDTGREHIEVHKDGTLHWVMVDRGTEYTRYTTTSLDELLYWTLREVAWRVAHRETGESMLYPALRVRINKRQRELLRGLNPEWEKRLAAEQ